MPPPWVGEGIAWISSVTGFGVAKNSVKREMSLNSHSASYTLCHSYHLIGSPWAFIFQLKQTDNNIHLRQSWVLSERTSMKLPSPGLGITEAPQILVLPPLSWSSKAASDSLIRWQVGIKHHHNPHCSSSHCLYGIEQYLEMMTFKKKFRIMKQEYNTVELLSSFHVVSPYNWNHFQVLFSTKLISHFHQETHVDPRVIQIFQYRNS